MSQRQPSPLASQRPTAAFFYPLLRETGTLQLKKSSYVILDNSALEKLSHRCLQIPMSLLIPCF